MSLLNTIAKALAAILTVAYVMIFIHISERSEPVEPIETPVVQKPRHQPVQISLDTVDTKSLECLALNIYHEARGESERGQVAVALVTRNRVEDPRFPNSYCGVVKQGRITSWAPATKINQCQFSWYCDGKSDRVNNMISWGEAVRIAYEVMYNDIVDFTRGATHYHADYVSPYWRRDRQLTRIKSVDRHVFYRWEQRA